MTATRNFVSCVSGAVALFGCATQMAKSPASEQPRVITLKSGQQICAVHRVPLITVRAYRIEGWTEETPLEEYYRKLEAQNPNRFLSLMYSRTRDKEHTVPTEVSYCPSCQAAMEGLAVYYGDERNF